MALFSRDRVSWGEQAAEWDEKTRPIASPKRDSWLGSSRRPMWVPWHAQQGGEPELSLCLDEA